MIIAGAKGHAKEVIQVLEAVLTADALAGVHLFDDTSADVPAVFLGKYPVITSLQKLEAVLRTDTRCILATGSPASRYILAAKVRAAGGELALLVAPTAVIGNHGVALGQGINVMHHVLITSEVWVGEGTLLNAGAALHHDVKVGRYNEISPGARLLGNCQTGDFCRIGAAATVLPNVKIGQHVVVGAGAVVTRNLEDHSVAVGVPARIIKKLPQPAWL